MCVHNNNVSYRTAKHDNSPLVVSPRTRGGACAAGVAAQFIINVLPLSADCDLERREGRGMRQKRRARRQKARGAKVNEEKRTIEER